MAISTATAAGGGGGGSMGRGMDLEHLVLPGQVIAVSSSGNDNNNNNDDGFLRGHGTYVERNARTQEERLIASVCGTVQRVNKLITVRPYCASLYTGQVGDFVIGRITSVGTTRWMVKVSSSATTSSSSLMKEAALPLSGVHLPGGAQRLRTAEDSLNMRSYLKEGDLVCSEVHKVQPNDGGSLSLHIRSHKFTKLENGIIVPVPAALIARRKNHVVSLIHNTIDGLWGVNGNIWLQRSMTNPNDDSTTTTTQETTTRSKQRRTSDEGATIADVSEKLRQEHAATPVDVETRRTLARLRNAIICLRSVHTMCTPEHVEMVYHKSMRCGPQQRCIPIPHMLYPETILVLTEEFR